MLAKIGLARLRLVVGQSAECEVDRYTPTRVVGRSSSNLFACPVKVAPARELGLADEQLVQLLCTAGSIPH